jgi:hypothetical protein
MIIFDVFTAVNTVFWDITRRGSCKNRCTLLQLLLTANVFPNSPILVTLMMEAIFSSETWVLKRVTRSNIPEYGIFKICYFVIINLELCVRIKMGIDTFLFSESDLVPVLLSEF